MMTNYSDRFLKAVEFVLRHETEYARGHYGDFKFAVAEHVAGDAGGTTKWGIDARSHPGVDIDALTHDQAVAIYYADYWLKSHAEELPIGVGEVIFDIRVNGGNGIRWLQEALTHIGIPCSADGIWGPATKKAAQHAGTDALAVLCKRREQYFRAIVDAHPGQDKFLGGWLARAADCKAFAVALA